MSEPHAIIGVRHLSRLAEMVADRRRVAKLYDEALAGFKNLRAVPVPEGCESNYYKYLAVMQQPGDRKAIKQQLRERFGVSLTGEVYEDPLHKQPVFEQYAERPMPIAEDLCARHVCLPVYAGMQDDEAQQVIDALSAVFEG